MYLSEFSTIKSKTNYNELRSIDHKLDVWYIMQVTSSPKKVPKSSTILKSSRIAKS